MAAQLDQSQLDGFKSVLEHQCSDLLNLLDATEEDARPVSEHQPIGRLTRVDALQQQGILLANRELARQRLKAILRALEKLASGDYGFCEDCGNLIAVARLNFNPEVAFCIECQSRRE